MNINTFIAFRSRNYRLYFTGQSISLIGTWMQRTAVSWIVYTLTHSTLMLGLTWFATQFPSFVFSLFGGVVSDRYNRYKVLLFTQVASLVQAAILTSLVFLHEATVWRIMGMGVLLGTINAFDIPARQALVYDMVDNKDDLPNAIALNSSMVNLARLIGPAVSGLVLERLGNGVSFLLNTASFLAVIISLLLMKLPAYIPSVHTQKVMGEMKEGFRYLKRTPSIGLLLLMLACMSLLVLPFTTLLPVYAKEIFKGNASTFGYLNSFIGAGSISGAFFLASLKPGTNLYKILLINTTLFGVGLILFSHEANFFLAMLFAALAGFGMMSQTTITNTILQTQVAKSMRGRVISFYAMAFFGMLPFGSILVGSVSNFWGAPNTLLSEGIIAIIIALLFMPFLRKEHPKIKLKRPIVID